MAATQPEHRPRQAGFTILELMVVVVILGLTARIVLANIGSWIPSSAMDSQANQLRAHIDFLRSEAKIQGKPYKLELDLDKHQYRLILPEEDLLTEPGQTAASAIPLQWSELDKNVEFDGFALSGGMVLSKGLVSVDFDEYGVAADQSIYLRYKAKESKLMWTIHLQGLSGTTSLVRDTEGKRNIFQQVTEADF